MSVLDYTSDGRSGTVAAELRNVSVHIATDRWEETVLTAVDLVVSDGQITALLGESGCGNP